MYIGVDIGGSKILVVAGNARHRILHSEKILTPLTAAQGVTEITHLIERVSGDEAPKAIAVAAPGPVDRKKGILFPSHTPNINWEPYEIVKHLKNHFKVPVVLEKDANAAALAESVDGAAAGYKYVLYVTISTGVGTGVVIRGEIYHGAHDPEGGHMYIAAEGSYEELEAAVSGKAIKRRFGKFGYEIHDPAIWDAYAHDLAMGLRNMITTISPDIVVIGGGVGVHFAKFEHALKKHLAEYKPLQSDPPIVPAAHVETAVGYGALILAARAV